MAHPAEDSDAACMTKSKLDLRTLCGGRVVLPGDAGYDDARMPWAREVDQRPLAIAHPGSVSDIQDLVRACAAAGLTVAPQATGHHAGALPDLAGTILVRLDGLAGVTIDPERRIARIHAGTLCRDAVTAAAAHGLTLNHGSSPDVSLIGYLLGGGLGWYSRRHGLASAALRSADVVTASGEVVTASATEHPDLFWALRGGGGSLGIVTSVDLDLLPYPQVYAGLLAWDRTQAEEVLAAWIAWTGSAPDAATTSCRLLNLPPLPQLPEPLRGRRLAVIDGVLIGGDDAADCLGPLRALAPEIDTFGLVPSVAATRIHLDPESPTPSVTDHALLGDLDERAVAQLCAVDDAALLAAELRHLGGGLARQGDGALSSLPGSYALFTVGIAATPEMASAGAAAGAAVVTALAPWRINRRYLNFTNEPVSAATGYDAAAWKRLGQVRDLMDPERRFVAAHPIGR